MVAVSKFDMPGYSNFVEKFDIKTEKKPAGDQPQAIEKLVAGLSAGMKKQTLLGVTGSGKTYTVANVIAQIGKPTLVIAHNKTLAAQLCNEFRELFPENAVHYFVSYYDYYQPEAYMPASDTYIEKEAMINEEIDRLRHAATASLLTRRDVIIVASVSCIYGLGAPDTYEQNIVRLQSGSDFDRKQFIEKLVRLQFTRTTSDMRRSTFRLRGDQWEIMPPGEDMIYAFDASGGKVGEIFVYDPVEGFIAGKTEPKQEVIIAPAKHFITNDADRERALKDIQKELAERLKYFEEHKMYLEAERLERRTKFDLAMMREVGYCHGIENYSRVLSGRAPGEAPDTLLSYFPRNEDGSADFLTIIDESHITVPQIEGMSAGDKARKQTLVDYGFRLPSAKDNRPLTFGEFESRVGQTIYTSATPGDFEIEESKMSAQACPAKPEGHSGVVEMIIRPTGLVDPEVVVRPCSAPTLSKTSGVHGRASQDKPAKGQVQDLIGEIEKTLKASEGTEHRTRVMVTTLTKKMAEELAEYLQEKNLAVKYLHSDVKTMDRITTLTDFRKGSHRGGFDVLVGVNLLREGLDLPEVSLVAILDADKEGFLRSETSLIQTIGRAARNVDGRVILYADNMTGSLSRAIEVTNKRREKQIAYNKEHGIIPKTIVKAITDIVPEKTLALETVGMSKDAATLQRLVKDKEREMKKAAKDLDFELAAILRDEVKLLKEELVEMGKIDGKLK